MVGGVFCIIIVIMSCSVQSHFQKRDAEASCSSVSTLTNLSMDTDSHTRYNSTIIGIRYMFLECCDYSSTTTNDRIQIYLLLACSLYA